MEDWLRFSVVYWHTFRWPGTDPFGTGTLVRPWEDGTDSLENAKRRMRVAFELFTRLGVKYYTFHDVDIAPQGNDIREFRVRLTLPYFTSHHPPPQEPQEEEKGSGALSAMELGVRLLVSGRG